MATGDVTAEMFSSRKVCLARAREHLGNRSYVAARQTLSRGVRQWPQFEFSHEFRTLLGHSAWRQGCLREAKRLLALATRDPDCHIESHFLLGRVLLDAGQIERAIALLSKILNDDDALVPYRVHAGGALSVAYSALGLNKSSQDALEEAAGFGLISAQLLADEGFRLLRIGAYPEAEVQLAKGLQVDSTCEDAFFRLGNALFIQSKPEPALEVLAYGIEQSPEFPHFYRLMAEIYTSRGQHKESAAFAKRALEVTPRCDDGDMLQYMLSASLQRAGRVESAMAGYRELLEHWPRSTLRQTVKLRLHALDNNSSGRTARLQGFPRKLQKRAYCAPNTLANVLTYSGVSATQDDVAARVMRGAGTHWPEVFDYLKEVEDIAWRAYFGSLDLLKRCIDNKLPVITAEYHGMSGHALAVIGYDDRGELLLAQDPRFFEPVEIPYREFERAWRHDDGLCIAVARASDAEKLPPRQGDEERLVNRAVELQRIREAGDLDGAAAIAAELADEAPEKQSPLRVLAEIALQRRDLDELKRRCEQALAKWPDCFWAHRHLGDAAWMAGNPDEAARHYRAARRLDRRDQSLSYTQAELLLSKGDRRGGRAFLLKALAEDPRFHRARLRMAEDLAETGETETAIFHARLLVEFEPDHQAARALLGKLAGNTAVVKLTESARKAAEELALQQEATKAEPAQDDEVEIDLEDL